MKDRIMIQDNQTSPMSTQFLGAPSLMSQACPYYAHAFPSIHHNDEFTSYMNHAPPPPTFHSQVDRHHGVKRSAPDDELESSANISTHFKKLRLNHAQLPHSSTASHVSEYPRTDDNTLEQECFQAPNHPGGHEYINDVMSDSSLAAASIHPPTTTASDFMPVDDTPERIYIHDLSAEIASIEASERPLSSTFLLPDFDKNVSKIPHNVLRQKFDTMANDPRVDDSQALVLYREPTSISVPPEEDVVRKAIIEARKRLRNQYTTANKYTLDSDDNAKDRATSQAGESLVISNSMIESPWDPSGSSNEMIGTNDDDMLDADAMEIE